MKPAIPRVAIIVALFVLGGCDRPPQPPDKTAPPEPQVRVQASLRDAMQTPVDRTKQVQIDEAGRQQIAVIEAAGG
jgi:uncharacterized lipoprotein YajG